MWKSRGDILNIELNQHELVLILSALNSKYINHQTGVYPATAEFNRKLSEIYKSMMSNIQNQMESERSKWFKPTEIKPDQRGQMVMVKTKNGKLFFAKYVKDGNMYHLLENNQTITSSGVAYWLDLRIPEPPSE